MSQILSRAPMPPRRLVPTIPVEFEQILLRLLDRDPERRYQRASDLLKDLEAVRGLDRPAEPPPAATTSMSIAVLPFAILGDEDETLRSFRDGLSTDAAWALQQLPGFASRRGRRRTVCGASPFGTSVSDCAWTRCWKAAFSAPPGTSESSPASSSRQLKSERACPCGLMCQAPTCCQPRTRQHVTSSSAVKSHASRTSQPGVRRTPTCTSSTSAASTRSADCLPANWNAVIEHATRATDIDPTFAPAHVMLADTYNSLGLLSLMKPRVAFQKARLAAERALAIDSDLATAHAALGLVRFGDDWDWNAAEAHFRRALDTDPDLASARVHYSWLLMLLGRETAALAEATRAVSTWHARFVVAGAALTYFLAGRYDDAIAPVQRVPRREPRLPVRDLPARAVLPHEGDVPRARMPNSNARRSSATGRRSTCACSARVMARPGMRDRALAIVREFDEMQHRRYVAPHCYVYVYYGLGRTGASPPSSGGRLPRRRSAAELPVAVHQESVLARPDPPRSAAPDAPDGVIWPLRPMASARRLTARVTAMRAASGLDLPSFCGDLLEGMMVFEPEDHRHAIVRLERAQGRQVPLRTLLQDQLFQR